MRKNEPGRHERFPRMGSRGPRNGNFTSISPSPLSHPRCLLSEHSSTPSIEAMLACGNAVGPSDGTILARHVLMRPCSRTEATASPRGVCHFAKNIMPLWRGCAVHSKHGSSEYQIDRHVHPLSASRDGNTHRQGARSEKHGDSLAHAGCPIRLELECCT